MYKLPPCEDQKQLEREVFLVPLRRRLDAIQESWVAHLSGKNPISAVKVFNRRESKFEKRSVTIPEEEYDDN